MVDHRRFTTDEEGRGSHEQVILPEEFIRSLHNAIASDLTPDQVTAIIELFGACKTVSKRLYDQDTIVERSRQIVEIIHRAKGFL